MSANYCSDEHRQQHENFMTAVRGGIREMIDGDEVAMIGKFVLIGEIIAADGDRELLVLPSDDASDWDVFGMIEFARMLGYAGADED